MCTGGGLGVTHINGAGDTVLYTYIIPSFGMPAASVLLWPLNGTSENRETDTHRARKRLYRPRPFPAANYSVRNGTFLKGIQIFYKCRAYCVVSTAEKRHRLLLLLFLESGILPSATQRRTPEPQSRASIASARTRRRILVALAANVSVGRPYNDDYAGLKT